MKKITTLCAVAVMAFFQMLPASAQSEVHLTFSRGGSDASSVTVSVKDADGNAIEGASATLESVQKGSGLDTYTALTNTTFKSTNDLASNTNFLCADYNNTQNDFTQYTFKISGLDDYAYQNGALKIAQFNKDGYFQGNSVTRQFKLQVWNTDEIGADNTIYTLSSSINNDVDNTTDFNVTGNSVNFTAKDNQYLVLRLTKTDDKGTFLALREITLKQKAYTVTTTATDNLGNVATFSADCNVMFDDKTTAYIATENGDNSVTLSKLSSNVLEAKAGAILITTGTTITATPTSAASIESRKNLLEGSGDAAKELTAGSYYILNKSGNNAVFSRLGSSSTTLAANKAALATSTGNSNALNIRFDDTTGIHSAATSLNAATGSRVYNLQGQAVTGKLAKGVYVKDGKKIIVK